MADKTVRLSDEFFLSAMQSEPVRAALRAKRDAIAAEVDGEPLINAKGNEVGAVEGLHRSEGTRPAGRPYARLAAAVEDDRGRQVGGMVRRVLGEAAARHTAPKGSGRG